MRSNKGAMNDHRCPERRGVRYVQRMMLRSILVLALCSLPSLTAGCGRASQPAADPVRVADPARPARPVDPARPTPTKNHGGCTYAQIEGTCTVSAPGMMVFTGTINGAAVTLPDNSLSRPAGVYVDAKVGATGPCTIEFETEGTCTPCMFSIGDCGKPAWDAFGGYKPGA